MSFRSALIAAASEEWEFFGRGTRSLSGATRVGRREYDDGAWQRVNAYWQCVHALYRPQYGHLTGRDRGWPWSAAFVSFCMQRAGAGGAFAYASGHARYINAALRAAAAGDGDALYRARRVKDVSPAPGDLVGYWWGETPVTFDNALALGWYNSHIDIVVETAPGRIDVIGGNVSDSVLRKSLRCNAQGRLTDARHPWFVVLQCQRA
jgi:hypothetical protein